MSSLPSLRSTASRLSKLPRPAAMTVRPISAMTGNSNSATPMMTAPGTRSPYWLVRPGLNLHRCPARQRGDSDRAACGPVVAETRDVRIVELGERAHVGEEAQRLRHVVELRA